MDLKRIVKLSQSCSRDDRITKGKTFWLKDSLGLACPEVDADMRKELEMARTALEAS